MNMNCIDLYSAYDMKNFKNLTHKYSPQVVIDSMWQSFSLKVVTTPCNYGGVRFWFQCPICGKRYRVLYKVHDVPACRECQGLKYASSQRTKTQLQYCRTRIRRVINKVDPDYQYTDNIPNEYDFPDKPKWMHWDKYARLHDQYRDEIERFNYAWLSGKDVSIKSMYMAYASGEATHEKLMAQALARIRR